MNMLRLKFIASFAWAAMNADASRLIRKTTPAPSTPATPAIQLVHRASTTAARWANAAHWRSADVVVGLGDSVWFTAPAPAGNQPARDHDGHTGRGRNPPDGPGLLHQAQTDGIAVLLATVGLD